MLVIWFMKLNNFAKSKAAVKPPQDETNRYGPRRAILILTFFRNPYFAYSQVLPLGPLVSELFLFLLYDLSCPCGYFFLASMVISMGK